MAIRGVSQLDRLRLLFRFLSCNGVDAGLSWSEYHRCRKDEGVLCGIRLSISAHEWPDSFRCVKRLSSAGVHQVNIRSPWLAQSGAGEAVPEVGVLSVIRAGPVSSKTTCATVDATTRACSCVNVEMGFQNHPELLGISWGEALERSVSTVACMSQYSCLILPQHAEALGVQD